MYQYTMAYGQNVCRCYALNRKKECRHLQIFLIQQFWMDQASTSMYIDYMSFYFLKTFYVFVYLFVTLAFIQSTRLGKGLLSTINRVKWVSSSKKKNKQTNHNVRSIKWNKIPVFTWIISSGVLELSWLSRSSFPSLQSRVPCFPFSCLASGCPSSWCTCLLPTVSWSPME